MTGLLGEMKGLAGLDCVLSILGCRKHLLTSSFQPLFLLLASNLAPENSLLGSWLLCDPNPMPHISDYMITSLNAMVQPKSY